ncbi:unnamed protein product, partial [Musa acuminata subsp. burmannicoides]
LQVKHHIILSTKRSTKILLVARPTVVTGGSLCDVGCCGAGPGLVVQGEVADGGDDQEPPGGHGHEAEWHVPPLVQHAASVGLRRRPPRRVPVGVAHCSVT